VTILSKVRNQRPVAHIPFFFFSFPLFFAVATEVKDSRWRIFDRTIYQATSSALSRACAWLLRRAFFSLSPLFLFFFFLSAYFAAPVCRPKASWRCSYAGIVLGNKEAFGFSISSFLLPLPCACSFVILPARRFDFALIGKHWLKGMAVSTFLMLVARPAPPFFLFFFRFARCCYVAGPRERSHKTRWPV